MSSAGGRGGGSGGRGGGGGGGCGIRGALTNRICMSGRATLLVVATVGIIGMVALVTLSVIVIPCTHAGPAQTLAVGVTRCFFSKLLLQFHVHDAVAANLVTILPIILVRAVLCLHHGSQQQHSPYQHPPTLCTPPPCPMHVGGSR